jgi:hypothetical protein
VKIPHDEGGAVHIGPSHAWAVTRLHLKRDRGACRPDVREIGRRAARHHPRFGSCYTTGSQGGRFKKPLVGRVCTRSSADLQATTPDSPHASRLHRPWHGKRG